jgi:hypothetical protein
MLKKLLASFGNSLNAIGKRSGTDKFKHGFLPFYEKHLHVLRELPVELLEIGIFKGNSLRMWSDYFQNGQIVGCDISRDAFITAPRVECRYLDQSSRDSLDSLKKAYPKGFDVILDDGSHVVSHQHITLGMLFPLVRPGGWYVLEDLHTSVGRSEKCFEIYGLDRDLGNSTYRMIQAIENKNHFSSPYMTSEEIDYIASHVDFCEIHESKNWSVTAILHKKQ